MRSVRDDLAAISSLFDQQIFEKGLQMIEPREREMQPHEIQYISEDQFSEYFHRLGWVVEPIRKDFGEDFFVRIFEGIAFTGRTFYVQLKGTKNIQRYALKKTSVFRYQVEIEKLLQWHRNKMLVIFVLWDIEQRTGYWLHIQPYVDKQLKKDPSWLEHEEGKRKSKRDIHIPFVQAIPGDGENALVTLATSEPPIWKILDDVQQALGNAHPYYRPEVHLTRTGINTTTAEKYPGAFTDHPLNIKFRTEIPTTTEEGRALVAKVQQFHDSGTPVEIPFRYVKNFEMPDVITQSLPEVTEESFILLGPVHNPNSLQVRFECTANDGEQVVLEPVHLKVVQAGQKEVTLTNEDQPFPVKVKLVLCSDGKIELDFSTPYTPHVHWLLKQLQLQTCISKQPSTVRLIDWNTGIPIATAKPMTERSEAPSLWFVQAIEALHALQLKTRKHIIFPDREPVEEELQVLRLLQHIFHIGKIEATWNSFTMTSHISPETIAEVRQFIKPFAEGKISELPIRFEETVTLFGVELPLGEIRPILVQARLANEKEVQEKLAEQKECEIPLQFVPAGDPTFVKEYLDWITL